MSELREVIGKAGFDAFWAEGTAYDGIEHAMWLQVADAVLAAIANHAAIVERDRWERVLAFVRAVDNYINVEKVFGYPGDVVYDAYAALQPTDLDPLP